MPHHAIPLESEHWAKRRQRKIIGGFVLVIVTMAVALGVSFGTTTEDAAGAATRVYGSQCFADNEELKDAVNDYTMQRCRWEEIECEVTQKYGWPIGSWCESNVTDMSQLFWYKVDFDNDLSSWDTSKVTTMKSMFEGASSFNGDVSNFETSKATLMESMFRGDSSFNGDVRSFNTSSVTSMEGMFEGASSFNRDVSGFDTSRVTSMEKMFDGATSFNQDVSGWDVASVTSMSYMFNGATSFGQNLCAWGVHYNATGVSYSDMFSDTNCPNQDDPVGPFTNWCTACSPTLSPTTSGEPTTSLRPTPSPTTMADCVAAGMQTFQVDVLTDGYPEAETTYTLVNLCTGLTETSRDFTTPYTLQNTSYTDILCVSDAKLTFTIYNSGDDGLCCGWGDGGYSTSYGGSVVASGGDFGSSDSTTFGTCAQFHLLGGE